MTPKQWVTKRLIRGDLTMLARIVNQQSIRDDADQIGRLRERGFIFQKPDNSLRATFKGRAALWIRRLSP